MPSVIIVTAADATYFELLRGLLTSIARHRKGPEMALGVFDLGLTETQRSWLDGRATAVVEPGWDLEVPEGLKKERPHLRGLTVRPFLPRHFPGYDIYLWIDADVWLQDWYGLPLFLRGAQQGCVTAVPHSDRAYPFRFEVLNHRRQEFCNGFGDEVANLLFLQQHLNAGIFAAAADSPLWRSWAAAYQDGIDNSGGEMMNDQIALNVACFRSRPPLQLLPAICNWQCHLALPMWNPDLRKFCEPMLPHQPISLLHLTHDTKNREYEIAGLDGRRRRMRLRAPEEPDAGAPAASGA